MINLLVLLTLSLPISAINPNLIKQFDSEACRKELQLGLQTLREMSHKLAEHEKARRNSELMELNNRVYNENSQTETTPTARCPAPLPTMFPPVNEEFAFPSIFAYQTEQDVYIKYMNAFVNVLKNEKQLCNGPRFTSTASITMEHIYGFAAILATNYAKPFCPICQQLVSEIRSYFINAELDISPEKRVLANHLMAHVPSAETLCSMLMPGCYEDLLNSIGDDPLDKTTSTTTQSTTSQSTTAETTMTPGTKPTLRPIPQNTTHCFKCQFCMTSTMIFMHKFLLNQDLVDQLWYLIQPTIIHNLCAELCLAFPPNQTTPNPIFPDGYGYEDCMVAADVVYHGGIKLLSRTLIPNKFCSKPLLNTTFCEKNETPNILHCLKGYCWYLDGGHSYLRIICDLIPDHPQDADKYLNIRQERKRNEL